jgi:formyl-CoA transferase
VINTYLTSDDVWVTVTSGTPRSVRKVAALLGEPDEDYRSVQQQNDGRERLDELLGEWVRSHTAEEALSAMQAAEVTASRIYTMQDIVADQTYREREAIISVDDPELGPVRMQAVIPRLTQHPGAVWRSGPALGQDTDDVLRDYIGMPAEEISTLRRRGII